MNLTWTERRGAKGERVYVATADILYANARAVARVVRHPRPTSRLEGWRVEVRKDGRWEPLLVAERSPAGRRPVRIWQSPQNAMEAAMRVLIPRGLP